MEGAVLFENGIEWLQQNYGQYRFFAERDVVWALQLYFINNIEKHCLPYQIFHGFTIPLNDGKKNVDLVLFNEDNSIEVAAEFKYEPSHQRKDLQRTKFPVVLWPELLKDAEAARKIVVQKKAKVAYSVLIDEGGQFLNQSLPLGSVWKPWNRSADSSHQAALLWLKVFNDQYP